MAAHHEKRKVMINLFTIPLFIGILVILTIFSKPLRPIVNFPRKLVAGAHDTKLSDLNKEQFTKEITQDTKKELNAMKDNVLQTTVGDILTFIQRGSKISKDAGQLKKQAEETVNNIDFDAIRKMSN